MPPDKQSCLNKSVHRRDPLAAIRAPAAGVTTTLSGPADAAGLVLSGERSDEITVVGEEWPLALLRKWIKRAQSG